MKHVGIIPNLDKDGDLSVTKKVLAMLQEKGCCPRLPEHIAEIHSLSQFSTPIEDIYETSDFLIVLGGDGTLLNAGRKTAQYNVPLLGINLGTKGFLTDGDRNDVENSIDKILQNDYKVEKRIMLEAAVINKYSTGESYIALNDVCVSRGVFSTIVNIRVYVNNEYLDTYRADGIIVSTPTGSTAYNLSAGGPILKPDTQIFAITPICPHALHARSIVVSADDIVTIEIGGHVRGELLISVDGQAGTSIGKEDVIRVKRSKYCTTIIKTNDLGFYDILRKKLFKNEE